MPLTAISFFLGVLAGGIGGYAGIGGAPLIVFGLTLAGVPQHLAQGTVLASLLGPISLPACLHLRKTLRPILGRTALATLSYAVASYLGGYLAFQFKGHTLSLLFAGFLILLGISTAGKGSGKGAAASESCSNDASASPVLPSLLKIVLSAALTGTFGGLLGIGAGILMVPLLLWMGSDKQSARALCLGMLLPPVTAGAVLKYWQMGSVSWSMSIAIFIGYISANLYGARVGSKHCSHQFQLILGIILALCGVASMVVALV